MKWHEVLRFGLEKLPEPMLEDGFRGLAVAGRPVEAHLRRGSKSALEGFGFRKSFAPVLTFGTDVN